MLKKTLTLLTLSTLPCLAFATSEPPASQHMPMHSGNSMKAMHAQPSSKMPQHRANHHTSQRSDAMQQHQGMSLSQAYGKAGDPSKVDRTIEITMDDKMRFTPNHIEVKEGETLRFAIKNIGHLPHEMVIGSLAELKAHAAEMLAMPQMQHHAEPNMLSLKPGQSGELIWHFDTATNVDFACLIPGHTEAGMTGQIQVK